MTAHKIRIEEYIEIQHSRAVIALFHIMQQKTLILTLICRFCLEASFTRALKIKVQCFGCRVCLRSLSFRTVNRSR